MSLETYLGKLKINTKVSVVYKGRETDIVEAYEMYTNKMSGLFTVVGIDVVKYPITHLRITVR